MAEHVLVYNKVSAEKTFELYKVSSTPSTPTMQQKSEHAEKDVL